jgi:Putative phage serine protease XkdF
VVCKQKDAPYPVALVTPDTWIKFHNETLLFGIVYGREKTKGGVWVYQYGVLSGKDTPVETITVGDKKIVPVGDSFGTKADLENGALIAIAAETVNLERSPEGVSVSAWVPRVLDQSPKKADTVDELCARARKDLVLSVKQIDENGNVTYEPTVKVAKQEDPYLEVPSEDGKYRFVVQHHWRGKTVHSDFRAEMEARGLLLGWTLNTQIEGVVKEPVTSLAAAKEWSTKEAFDKVSKINWVTGQWAKRPKAGAGKLVQTEILSERKAPEPHAWLDVEGKTKDPAAGSPPPVGGTRNYPGVFDIVAQGTLEYGAQKPWFHEYFLHGEGTDYRLIFRQLKVASAKAEKCEACGGHADVSLAWEDAPAADFCETCVKKADVVLPPSEDQPLGREGFAWLAIRPDDLTPYVLGGEAVTKKWMPPDGVSALPAAVRKQVPKEHQYWLKRGAAALALRDKLVEAVGAGEVKLDYESVFKVAKASLLEADFVLQEQTFRGPVQIRIGPTTTKYWVRLDIGRSKLLVIGLLTNPFDNESVAAQVEYDSHKASMDLSGKVPPGHYLNPTKETPSYIEVLDSGKAEVTSLSKDLVKVKFSGKELKGMYLVTRNADEWLWEKEQEAPKTQKTAKSLENEFEIYFPFEYVRVEKRGDSEKRLVTGIVLEPDEVDAQKDWERAEVIERAAHNFLANYNRPSTDGGTLIGLMHKTFEGVGVELVESYIAPEEFHLGGTAKSKKVKKGSWVMTVHISSDKTWKDVKSGKLTGFSVGGTAISAGNGE